MPAAPEILNAVRKIRLPEVHHEMETQHLRASPGNVAVAAEVAVNLPRECIHPQQSDGQTRFPERSAKGRIRNQGAVIRDHALAEQSLQNQQQAIKSLVRIPVPRFLDLRKQVRRPLDGTRDQVRK